MTGATKPLTSLAGLVHWGRGPTPQNGLSPTGAANEEADMPKAVKRITLDFDADVLDSIDVAARARHMSRSAWIKKACEVRLARQKDDDRKIGQ